MKNKLFNWFKHTEYGKHLSECYNGYHKSSDNIYHEEQTVLEHIEMVMDKVERFFRKDKNYIDLLVGAMLHDIGKIYARKENDEKQIVHFYNHEHIGFYHASQVLSDLCKSEEFNIVFKDKRDFIEIDGYELNRLNVLKIVSFHDIYKYNSKEILNKYRWISILLLKFGICDNHGRISNYKRSYNHQFISDIKSVNNRIWPNMDPDLDNRRELIFVIGLPRSGKSTYCKQNFKENEILNRDYFIENNPFVNIDYNSNWAYLVKNNLQKEIDKLYDKRFLEMIRDENISKVVIDKVNLNKSSRSKLLSGNVSNFNKEDREKLKNMKKVAVIMTTPYEECVSRGMNKSDKCIDRYVMDDFVSKSCIPDYSEFDRIIYY